MPAYRHTSTRWIIHRVSTVCSDDQQRVGLYVGKARNLKKRVSNYAKPSGHSARIATMISRTASMMFLTTKTETEALLLEQNLIKQLKPKYNVLLRDDKSFPNILVAKNHDFPQIKKHRGAKKEKGDYYGPFASAGAVNRTLNQLQPCVPVARLYRQQFRDPHAALSTVSDQALLRALRGSYQPRGLRRAGQRCRAFPDGPLDKSAGGSGQGDAGRLGSHGVRACCSSARPASAP